MRIRYGRADHAVSFKKNGVWMHYCTVGKAEAKNAVEFCKACGWTEVKVEVFR